MAADDPKSAVKDVMPPPSPPSLPTPPSGPAPPSRPSQQAGGTFPHAPRIPGEIPPIAPAPSAGLYQRCGKRILDVFLSALALLLLSPVIGLTALAIKLDSRGPVFYRSWRVGECGRRFRFLKFRSMVQDADRIRESLQHLNEVSGPVFKMAHDPRITRVGAWLRRTSLDELPQLWNVLRGDMALVGPRPPIKEEVLLYEAWQLRRLSVRPGITCLWQISGRSRIGFDEWMRLDLEYIEGRSFSLDVKILLRTLPAVLSGEGAY
jgi:lipopolysaccharide/colanic/teichoic acid biosynthesis glycosyltransferase